MVMRAFNPQKNSVSMERMLRTIKLFARVTKASLGKMSTAPISSHQRPPELRGAGLTNGQEVGTESERVGAAVVKPVGPGPEVDRVDEHEHEVKAVHKAAAEDCENVSGSETQICPPINLRSYTHP